VIDEQLADVRRTMALLERQGLKESAQHIRLLLQELAATEARVKATEAQVRAAEAQAMTRVPDGWQLVQKEPTISMLLVWAFLEFPEDWNRGKAAQSRLGVDRVPLNMETAWGQYERMLAIAPQYKAEQPEQKEEQHD
jgi:hypothetical protein